METSYRELKCKFVVNVTDGRNLGKTTDIVFTYPEGRVLGIAVPGKNGLRLFKREDLFISLHNVVKIGADVVLVDLKNARPDGGKRDECPPGGRRYDVG
ncbi:MAG TPA: YlmC/YmxH family sporulation protein [Candidatus Borkfalkia faecigallinarum]|uniref:YlmC/YmxH family sporulation protein n=1 Tax=Candidatus Borkfalkia faecigallinarum TaxID=2838509 RepID=A0A9D1VV34_9FIRM|nr:YlmC/YmxH family sporulation protein [Candidatus Borkfalkia faecigallinarum]